MHDNGDGTGCVCSVRSCRKGHLSAVRCAHVIGGIRPDIVGGVGGKSSDVARERARAAAIGGVVVADGRGAGGVPAHAACGNGCATVTGDVSAGGGGGGTDITHRVSGYGRWVRAIAKDTANRIAVTSIAHHLLRHIGLICIESNAYCTGIIIAADRSGTPNTCTASYRTPCSTVARSTIVSKTSGRHRTEARGIVRIRVVAWHAWGAFVVPTRSRSQCFCNVCTVVTTQVCWHSAHIVGQLRPFRSTWQMPSCRADALHTTWIITAAIQSMHGSGPIIEMSVCGHIICTIVRIVTIRDVCNAITVTSRCTIRDFYPVRIVCRP